MKPHTHLRAVSAMAGGSALFAIGLLGMSVGSHSGGPGSQPVLAPATGVGPTIDEVTTTSTAPSFRPVVTATVPPPPLD